MKLNFFKGNIFYFLLFFTLNLILKLIFINHQPFSYDEIISIGAAQEDFGHIKHMSEWDNNPPFYYYCLWVWLKFFPINVFTTRLLSVIFVSLAIGLNFILIRSRLNFVTAIISSLLLSLSNLITFYSHDVRTYSLILLLSITSTLIFFKFLQKPNYLLLFVLGLLNFLIIYSHYIAGLIILCQYIFVFIFEKKQLKKIFLFQSGFIILLVGLRFTSKQFNIIFGFNSKGDFWLKPATFNDFLSSLNELFFSLPLLIIFVLLSVFGFVLVRKNMDLQQKKFLFYCLLLGHFCILLLYILGTFKAIYLSRYLIFVIPFFAAFTIHTIGSIKKVGYLLSALILIFPIITINLNPVKGMEYEPITHIIKRNYNNESCVIINTKDNLNVFFYYYDYDNFVNFKRHDSLFFANRIFGINDTNQIKELSLEKFNTIYLVQTFNKKIDGDDIVKKFLSKKYTERYFTNKYNATEFTIYKKL